MITVKFYDKVNFDDLKFVIIVAKYGDKLVFSKHKNRDTYEFPGGHIEKGEEAIKAAKRELYEESGAIDYNIKLLGYYSIIGNDGIIKNDSESFGAIYFAQISKLGALSEEFEMEKTELFDKIPDKLTYPTVVEKIIEKYHIL